MFDLFLKIAPWVILLAVPVTLFGLVCTINQMHWTTVHKPVALAYVMLALGWVAIWFGVLDYVVHAPPMFWPVYLLGGLFLLALGNAALFFVDRRHRCSACAHGMRGCP